MAKVQMDRADYLKEHKHLVKVLEKGGAAARQAEASKQKREVSEKKKGGK